MKRQAMFVRLAVVIVVSLVSVTTTLGDEKVSLFASNSEPIDGIRGMKWGAGIQDILDKQFVRDTEKYGLTKVYRRKNEILSVGDMRLADIEYYFCEGTLYQVNFITQGKESWGKLKSIIRNMYPDFFQPTEIQVAPGLYAQVAAKGRQHFNFGGLDVYDIDTEQINFIAEYKAETEKGTFAVISKKIN